MKKDYTTKLREELFHKDEEIQKLKNEIQELKHLNETNIVCIKVLKLRINKFTKFYRLIYDAMSQLKIDNTLIAIKELIGDENE